MLEMTAHSITLGALRTTRELSAQPARGVQRAPRVRLVGQARRDQPALPGRLLLQSILGLAPTSIAISHGLFPKVFTRLKLRLGVPGDLAIPGLRLGPGVGPEVEVGRFLD